VQLIFFTINFIIFAIALVFLLRKPVSNYLKDRKNSFINGHEEAKKHYDDALGKLNGLKDSVRNIDKEGDAHVEEIAEQAREEARVIVLNAASYSTATMAGTEEMLKAEIERAKNKEVTNFIHSVIAKTETEVKKGSVQNDYSEIYIKNYFAASKRVEG